MVRKTFSILALVTGAAVMMTACSSGGAAQPAESNTAEAAEGAQAEADQAAADLTAAEAEVLDEIAGPLDLSGSWEDEVSKRAVMSAARKKEGSYVITVSWGGSATEAAAWEIEGHYDEASGMLTYENARHYTHVVDAEGNESTKDETTTNGAFMKEGEKVRWKDSANEEDGVFVKVSEEEPETGETTAEDGTNLSDDASDFVLLSEAVPDAILEIRYYSTYNFVGDRIDGYEEPVAILTEEAAAALKEASDDLISQGYRLKIYDAYRPQMAVDNFMAWALDEEDVRMKQYFYPELDKDVLFPQGYIAEHSGHSRGSTVDLTLFDMETEKEVDMGGTFDYFGELSHPDYTDITEEQYENRMILREAMMKHGFKPLEEEWWHFTLVDEPYPDTYFTFPVNSTSITGE